jgi:hypothetical protein
MWAGQVFGHPYQVWCQSLSTDVIEALIDDLQGVVHISPIAPFTLFLPRSPFQATVQQPYQSLAVLPCHRLHFVQELGLRLPVSSHVASLHGTQILPLFIYSHFLFTAHSPLASFLYEGTILLR